jgi:hypothetical protein
MAMNDAQRKLAHAPEGPHAFAQPGWFTDNYRLCAVCGCRSDHPIHAQADAPDSAAPPCACEEPHLRGRHTPQRCYVDMEQPAAEADAPDSAAPPAKCGSTLRLGNYLMQCSYEPNHPGDCYHGRRAAAQADAPTDTARGLCSMCGGSGEVEGYDVTQGPDAEILTLACRYCGGTGAQADAPEGER